MATPERQLYDRYWPFSACRLFGETGQVGCKRWSAAMQLGGQVRCNYALEAMNLGKGHLWAIFIHLDAWILHQGLVSKWALAQAVTGVA